MFWLNQIPTDTLTGNLHASFMNKAKNELVEVISAEEEKEYAKLYPAFRQAFPENDNL
jgi:hypothetical protein